MVHIKEDFDKSFKLLLHYKKVVVPVMISILIPIIFIFIFFNISGLESGSFAEFIKLDEEFLSAHPEFQGENIDEEAYENSWSEFLKQKGYVEDPFEQFLKNLGLLIAMVSLSIIFSLYFSSMSYVLIAYLLKGKKYTIPSLFKKTTSYFLKWISLKIIFAAIIIAPALLLTIIIIPIFYLSNVFGVVSIVIAALLFGTYAIIASLRLLFSTPAMYLEERGPIKSIKSSYHVTKGHFRQLLIVALMISAIKSLNIYLSNKSVFYGLPTDFNPAIILVSVIIAGLFLLIESFISTFEHIFVLYTYMDFEELEDVILRKD